MSALSGDSLGDCEHHCFLCCFLFFCMFVCCVCVCSWIMPHLFFLPPFTLTTPSNFLTELQTLVQANNCISTHWRNCGIVSGVLASSPVHSSNLLIGNNGELRKCKLYERKHYVVLCVCAHACICFPQTVYQSNKGGRKDLVSFHWCCSQANTCTSNHQWTQVFHLSLSLDTFQPCLTYFSTSPPSLLGALLNTYVGLVHTTMVSGWNRKVLLCFGSLFTLKCHFRWPKSEMAKFWNISENVSKTQHPSPPCKRGSQSTLSL